MSFSFAEQPHFVMVTVETGIIENLKTTKCFWNLNLAIS